MFAGFKSRWMISQGSVGYEVVPAPEGVETKSLPPERAAVTLAGTSYFMSCSTVGP